MIQFIINEGLKDNYTPPSGESSTNSSFIGITLEPIMPSAPLNLIPRAIPPSEPSFEIVIKIDTTTSINFDDYVFDDGKLRPLSSSSSITKVGNSNEFEYYNNNEETTSYNTIVDSSSEIHLIDNDHNTNNTL
jgi:hypothetical protein